MTGFGISRHWHNILVASLLLVVTCLMGWTQVPKASAAPLFQQPGVDPIRDPSSCTPIEQGGVFINFDDLPNGTHVAEQYEPLGVHFLDTGETTPLIYDNAERTTISPPNSLTNDADLLSEGAPLVMLFDAPQSTVGFYMGNGTANTIAEIRAYSDAAGTIPLGSVIVEASLSNNVTTFYGVRVPVGTASEIRRIEFEYLRTTASEEIDNLCVSKAQAEPLPYTFTGRVLKGGPLESPTSLPGVVVQLYGSNNSTSLGTLLDQDTSVVDTGGYILTTNLAFLYYTLVEGSAPQGYCHVKAVPGSGAVALDKARIQYASPPPGSHPDNHFYNTTGPYCNPLPPVEPAANLVPFAVALQQVPHPVITDVDLQGTRIEVSQSIQDNSNSVEQVIKKWTVARVYLTSGTTTTVNNVLVRLHVYIDDVEKAVADVRTRAVPVPLRINVNDSANFYLVVLSGSDENVGFYAEIDPTNEIAETNNANNRYPAVGRQYLTFYKRQTIKVAYAPIHYNPPGWGGAQDPTSRINTAIDWLRSMYPVPNYDARSVVYYPYPGFTFSQNVNTYDDELISQLNTRWSLSHWGLSWLGWFLGIDVGPSSSMLYGWLPDGAYGDNGLSDPTWHGGDSHVAFGNDKADKYRRTLAHEIGHNLGLCHNNYTINPDIGFDVFLSHSVKDTNFKDVMWPARVESEAWITKLNYRRIFNWLAPGAPMPPGTNPCLVSEMASPNTTSTLGATAPLAATDVITGVHEFAFISGSVDITGTGTLDPIYVDIRNSGDIPPSIGSQYCVNLVNADDEAVDQHCFTPSFSEPIDSPDPRPRVAFNFPMLWNPSTTHIELLKDFEVLATRTVSKSTPEVNITTPNSGESYPAGSIISIKWNASDGDDDPLVYSVFYSPDGGASWLPVASGLTDTGYDLPAALVSGSEDAFVKVLATDGVNTGQDRSDAGFRVERKSPQVYITTPVNGTFILANSAVPLNGIGFDLEDGNLDGESLDWSSSRDGPLGSGPSLVLPSLSNGLHMITLSVTDSDDNTTTASIEVFVGQRLVLPISIK